MDLNSQPTASSEWFDPEEAECQWAAVASEADGGQSVTTAELKSSDAVDGGVAYSLELRDYTFANGAWKFEKMDTVPPGDAAETLTALRPAAHRIDPDLLYEARLLHRAGEEPMRPRPLTKAEIRETGGLAQVKALLRPSLLRRGSAIAMERGAGESAAKVAITVFFAPLRAAVLCPATSRVSSISLNHASRRAMFCTSRISARSSLMYARTLALPTILDCLLHVLDLHGMRPFLSLPLNL